MIPTNYKPHQIKRIDQGAARGDRLRGLNDMTARPKRREPFRTQSVELGRLRLAGIDNIGESLAIAEGEAFK